MALKHLHQALTRRQRSIIPIVTPRQCLSASQPPGRQPVLAIRQEESSIWERRAPLSPDHVEKLTREGVKVLVQPCHRRAYTMSEYERVGAVVTRDIMEADVIIGTGIMLYVAYSILFKSQQE